MKEEHYIELGSLIYNFQALEQTIAYFTSEFISKDQNVGNIITSKMSFKNLCEIFAALFSYRYKNSELDKKIKILLTNFKAIEDRRNTYVHSTWGFPATQLGEGALRIKKRLKKNRLSFDLEVLKEDDLKKLNQKILKVIDELLDLLNKAKSKDLIIYSK